MGCPSAPELGIRRLHLLGPVLEPSDAYDRNRERNDELPGDRLVTEPGIQNDCHSDRDRHGSPDDHDDLL